MLNETAESIEGNWNSLKNTLKSTASSVLGSTIRHQNDWISDRTIELADRASKARLAKQSDYKDIRRLATRSARSDRNRYWDELASKMENASRRNDTQNLYSILRRTSGKRMLTSEVIRSTSGEIVTDTAERLERWKVHFEELLNFPAPAADNRPNNGNHSVECYSTDCHPPTAEEIEQAIASLKCNKAPGEDGIPAEIYKCCSGVLNLPLERLFCQIWSQEEFPQDWQDAMLLPFFKKGDKTLCTNYRGVSLIDVAAKIFTTIILKRFQSQRDMRTRHNQAGFRTGRGCLDQIFSLRRILEHRWCFQQPTIVCFIDFTAAFDSVDRGSLWRLMEQDGVPMKIINLLRAYYHRTRARVQVYGEVTDKFAVHTGVRQGCILSPVLFNFTIDWILRNALSQARGVELAPRRTVTDLDYADGIALLSSSFEEMQSLVTRIDELAASIGMRINPQKTKLMCCNISSPRPSLLLHDTPLEEVSHFKYLGSVVSPTGQADLDIAARINSARTAFCNLTKVLWGHKDIRLQTKIRIYQAMVRTLLLYGCECWQLRVSDSRKLEVFDHWCLRRILRVRWQDRISNVEVRRRCRIRCLSLVIKERRLRWFGHILRKPSDEIVSICLNSLPCTGWKKRHGGQRKSWMSNVKEDLEVIAGPTVYGLRRWNRDWLNIAHEQAKNRDAWRAQTRDILEAG